MLRRRPSLPLIDVIARDLAGDDGDGGERQPAGRLRRRRTPRLRRRTPPMAHLITTAILLLVAYLHSLGRVTSQQPCPAPAPVGPIPAHRTRWAVLVAGSSGYRNYRHQADVCHAYQVLKRGGVKDENIVVFMADDIADHEQNPRPGVIINRPTGDDVYAGVPKDYTGNQVTVNNFLAVLLGNQSALTGGSGKVLNGGPDDHVFIFYVDHGSPGSVEMPTGPDLYADDLVNTLKKMHDSKSYGSLVFYLEACESGSMFEGLLPEDIGVYATTASNAEETSYATYCPRDRHPGAPPSGAPPPGYEVCLGDLYSVSWMEDSEEHDLRFRTLRQQYDTVTVRASVNKTYKRGSHAMQYGYQKLEAQRLSNYFGTAKRGSRPDAFITTGQPAAASGGVNQGDAHLLYFWNKFIRSKEGSPGRADARKQLLDVISHQSHVDSSMEAVGSILFGPDKSRAILEAVRPPGQPLVDDWDCLKKMVRTFETYCGSLGRHGRKRTRAVANICNAGIGEEKMAAASSRACPEFPSNPWSSLRNGFSA